MEPQYVLILDFCTGVLNIIKLTAEELRESENYEDFEDFLSTIEEKYGFRLKTAIGCLLKIWISIVIKMGRRSIIQNWCELNSVE